MVGNDSEKRLLVTGAHGFLAGAILAQGGDEWQVPAVSRTPPAAAADVSRRTLPGEESGPTHVGGYRGTGPENRRPAWHVCDPLAPDQLARLFEEVRPDAVIHTAAIADIDFCQAHPDLARAVNVELTRSLAGLCADMGTRLVFCSTDTVFDGEHAPYREDDPPGPVNLYAEAKVEAEQLVGGLGAQAAIARLSLVVGLPALGAGNSFLVRMLAELKNGRAVRFPAHEIRTPVDVITAGRALLELAAGDHHGIFHLAGSSRLTRLDMARQIAARFGFPEHLVEPQAADAAPGRAPRPRDVSLVNDKACAALKTPMRTLDEGLSLILAAGQGAAWPS